MDKLQIVVSLIFEMQTIINIKLFFIWELSSNFVAIVNV